MINISIIGCGNMGSALVWGLSAYPEYVIKVADPDPMKLVSVTGKAGEIGLSQDNKAIISGADVIILAVKPYLVETVIKEIESQIVPSQIIISLAPGVEPSTFFDTTKLTACHILPETYIAVPTTAISVSEGMTFISGKNTTEQGKETVLNIFRHLGTAVYVDNKLQLAGTALCSCGIAYAYKYVQACIQAGVQLGFKPDDALKYVTQTVKGAMDMLAENGTLPQQEIDRVTTPGGMTIKGINQLDRNGFTGSVIDAILTPLQNK